MTAPDSGQRESQDGCRDTADDGGLLNRRHPPPEIQLYLRGFRRSICGDRVAAILAPIVAHAVIIGSRVPAEFLGYPGGAVTTLDKDIIFAKGQFVQYPQFIRP